MKKTTLFLLYGWMFQNLFIFTNLLIAFQGPLTLYKAWLTVILVPMLCCFAYVFFTVLHLFFYENVWWGVEKNIFFPTFYETTNRQPKNSFTFFVCYEVFAFAVFLDNLLRSARMIAPENSFMQNSIITVCLWALLSIFSKKIGRTVFTVIKNNSQV